LGGLFGLFFYRYFGLFALDSTPGALVCETFIPKANKKVEMGKLFSEPCCCQYHNSVQDVDLTSRRDNK
jgi:hypothetical protein